MKVEFFRHRLGREDAEAIADILATPFLTTGQVSARVEDQLCDYFNVPHALLCNSWTNGALALLLALGIGPGDEVIVPAMTFIASANVVELTGAKAILVDVCPDTLLLKPEVAAAAVTARTRAVIPVHLYGQMVDIQAMRAAINAVALADQHIALIEDCAHCFEGRLNGDRPGTHSDAAVFSFYATKNVTCGEGGAIILRDTALFEATRETRLHGMSAMAAQRFSGDGYNHWDMHRLGTKANLPDLLAALLPRQIDNIDSILPERQALAERYVSALADLPFRTPKLVTNGLHAWHLFTIGVPEAHRDASIAVLNKAGISVTVNYRALPDLRYYGTRYPEAAAICPTALTWGRQTITLPLYPGMPEDQQDHVIATLRNEVAPLLADWAR
jgi:UDP-4-amino-4-deoxy-L-arabinose-oxoglutarate aminotransferase